MPYSMAVHIVSLWTSSESGFESEYGRKELSQNALQSAVGSSSRLCKRLSAGLIVCLVVYVCVISLKTGFEPYMKTYIDNMGQPWTKGGKGGGYAEFTPCVPLRL